MGQNLRTSDEQAATTPLAGTELVRIVQSGNNRRATTQDIADLGGGGGSGMATNGSNATSGAISNIGSAGVANGVNLEVANQAGKVLLRAGPGPAGTYDFRLGYDGAGIAMTGTTAAGGWANANVNLGFGGPDLATVTGVGNITIAAGYYRTLGANVSGNYNFAAGGGVLQAHTAGDYNVAIGGNALWSDLNSNAIVAIGKNAGYGHTTGNREIFIGNDAGWKKVTGEDSVVIGTNAGGDANWTGNGHILIGTGVVSPAANFGINIGGEVIGTLGQGITAAHDFSILGNASAPNLTTGHGSQTATSGAATLNQGSGIITSEALTAATSYTLTLTNSRILSTSTVLVNAINSAQLPVTVNNITITNGQVVVLVGMAALTGTVRIFFAVFN